MTQNSWVGGDAVCDHALSLAVGRALEKAPQFIAGMPGAIALLVSEMSPSCYIAALGLCLFKEKEDDRPSLMAAFDDELPKNMINRYRTHCLTSKRSVIVARQEADLPQPVRLAVDHVLHVEPMSPADLQRACKSMLGARVTEKQAIEALSYPKEHLWDALRKGRNFDLVLARLRDVCSAMSQPKLKKDTEGPKLEAMHGYGEAKSWGLQLARDINDWRSGKIRWADVDRGALLSGPTGVGKTVYAAGLARQCDATLITTSISQWQSKGHLGDMLAAMRADFARAARETPSILFLDELDSVGDRSLFAGKNANYETQVVNALLECMDGSIAREGTVIIGATNNPASIDPAILRPGRLDRHLVINLPGIEDRINIIGQHLG
ncbi:MAG: ATP-binding protein, partial [Verrucomicrobiaceae bacterium]